MIAAMARLLRAATRRLAAIPMTPAAHDALQRRSDVITERQREVAWLYDHCDETTRDQFVQLKVDGYFRR